MNRIYEYNNEFIIFKHYIYFYLLSSFPKDEDYNIIKEKMYTEIQMKIQMKI